MELKTKNTMVSFIGSLVIILLAVSINFLMMSSKEEVKSRKKLEEVRFVNAKKVEYQNYDSEVEALGRVISINKINVFSEVQGVLLSKNFKTGQKFSKGDILLEVDDSQIMIDLQSTRSKFIKSLIAIMGDIKIDFPSEYEKWNNYINKINLNESTPEIPNTNSSKEKFFINSKSISDLYFSIKNLELKHSKHKIKAPFSGVVLSHNIEKGALVLPNQNLGVFANTNNFEVELSVENSEIPFISIGNKVEFAMNDQDHSLAGRIVRISDNVDPNSQTVKCYAIVDGSGIKDGMYLNARILGRKIKDVFKINRTAISNNKWLFTIDESKLDKVEANIVKINKQFAFVNGLDSNLVVVTDAVANLNLGSKVQAIEEGE